MKILPPLGGERVFTSSFVFIIFGLFISKSDSIEIDFML